MHPMSLESHKLHVVIASKEYGVVVFFTIICLAITFAAVVDVAAVVVAAEL
jgi:hypothetical protein